MSPTRKHRTPEEVDRMIPPYSARVYSFWFWLRDLRAVSQPVLSPAFHLEVV
jgi:hypothetical protein